MSYHTVGPFITSSPPHRVFFIQVHDTHRYGFTYNEHYQQQLIDLPTHYMSVYNPLSSKHEVLIYSDPTHLVRCSQEGRYGQFVLKQYHATTCTWEYSSFKLAPGIKDEIQAIFMSTKDQLVSSHIPAPILKQSFSLEELIAETMQEEDYHDIDEANLQTIQQCLSPHFNTIFAREQFNITHVLAIRHILCGEQFQHAPLDEQQSLAIQTACQQLRYPWLDSAADSDQELATYFPENIQVNLIHSFVQKIFIRINQKLDVLTPVLHEFHFVSSTTRLQQLQAHLNHSSNPNDRIQRLLRCQKMKDYQHPKVQHYIRGQLDPWHNLILDLSTENTAINIKERFDSILNQGLYTHPNYVIQLCCHLINVIIRIARFISYYLNLGYYAQISRDAAQLTPQQRQRLAHALFPAQHSDAAHSCAYINRYIQFGDRFPPQQEPDTIIAAAP